MGSNNPVPSRAAIHALRGLVFGTSCSVVLIAEERRRRLKTVKAAAENARKIHAAKSHRGASDLAWEARLLHRNEEALASVGDSPSPRNFRRTQPDKRRARALERTFDDGSVTTKPSGGSNQTKTNPPPPSTSQVKRKNQDLPSPGGRTKSAFGEGLAAWVDGVSSGDALRMSVNAAKTQIMPKVPAFTPPRREGSPSKLQRELSQWERTESYLGTATDGNDPDSAESPTQQFVRETTQDVPKSTLSFFTTHETRFAAEQDSQNAKHDMTAVKDGMAQWEARLENLGTTSQQPPRTKILHARSPISTTDKEVLAQAGDGLARWEKVARRKSRVHTEEVPGLGMRSSEPLPRLVGWQKLEPASTAAKPGHPNTKTVRRPTSILQTLPSRTAAEEKAAWRSLFKKDGSGHFQPNFDSSEIEEVAPRFIRYFKQFGIQANPHHRWLHGCLLLESLLAVYNKGDNVDVDPLIRSTIRALENARADAPESLRHRPYDICLVSLQSTVRDPTVNNLREHLRLLLSTDLDNIHLLSDFAGWIVRTRNVDALKHLVSVLQHPDLSTTWQDGRIMSSLLQHSTQAFVSPRDLFLMLREIGFAEEKLPLSVLAEFGKHIVTMTAVIQRDVLALEILDKVKEQDTTRVSCWVAQALVVLDCRQCKAADVLAGIERITQTPDGETWLQTWRSQLVSIFVSSHEPAENEAFLRGAFRIAPFPMEQAWVQRILSHYSDLGELDKFLDWLRFSVQSGFQFDQISFPNFLTLLSDRWRFTPRNIHQVRDAAKPFLGRGTGLAMRSDPANAAREGETFAQMLQLCRDRKWDVAIKLYREFATTDSLFSSRCLGLAVTACLSRDGSASHTARDLLRQDLAKGNDVSNETARLLTASFLDTADPERALATASEQGFDIPASVYNSVARTLAGELKSPMKALRVCERWATAHGDGRLGFDEKHFSTLLRIYVLLNSGPAFAALGELIQEFIRQPRWWHRSDLCKETIKYQQKWIRKRGDKWELTDAVLHSLDLALEHVAQQRALCGNPDWIAEEVAEILSSPQGLAVTDPGVTATVRQLEGQATCRLALTGRSTWPSRTNQRILPTPGSEEKTASSVSELSSVSVEQFQPSVHPVSNTPENKFDPGDWQRIYHEVALDDDSEEFEAVHNMSHAASVLA